VERWGGVAEAVCVCVRLSSHSQRQEAHPPHNRASLGAGHSPARTDGAALTRRAASPPREGFSSKRTRAQQQRETAEGGWSEIRAEMLGKVLEMLQAAAGVTPGWRLGFLSGLRRGAAGVRCGRPSMMRW
jgi:hypothetical protein